MNGDNPAARLHAILIKAKSRSGNENCRNGLRFLIFLRLMNLSFDATR